jgi:hypothetical protein
MLEKTEASKPNMGSPPLLQNPPLSEFVDTLTCWSCGTRFNKGHDVCADRFCSERCRDWFDRGGPRFGEPARGHGTWRVIAGRDPGYLPSIEGFAITCLSCDQSFASKGLRCCSTECERKHRERAEIRAALTEAGIKPSAKRRKCECCGGNIPRFRGTGKARRAVRQDARFCSPACAKKASPTSHSQNPVFGTIEVKKCP